MLSVATLVIIIAGIGWIEGYRALASAQTYREDMPVFAAVLTLGLSTMLGVVGILWEFGAFGMPSSPYLLPKWSVLIDHINGAYGLGNHSMGERP